MSTETWTKSSTWTPSVAEIRRVLVFFSLSRDDSGTSCKFPLEIVIIQDLTVSFADDIPNMVRGLDNMSDELVTSHPDTRAALVSVKDKPIWPLGTEGLYCARQEMPFSRDLDQLGTVYNRLVYKVYGGGDMPEAQFHALLATARSNFVGWGTSTITKLIILITDAAPHFADDGFNTNGLPPFEVPDPSKDLNEGCETMYYPSPEQVAVALLERGTYVGFLISGASYNNNLVGGSWQWFNSMLGQLSGFYQEIEDDSSNFWEQTQKIIGLIEGLECGVFPTTTTAAPSQSGDTTTTTTTPPPVPSELETNYVSAPSNDVSVSTPAPRGCGDCPACAAYGCTCCCGLTEHCPYKTRQSAKRLFVSVGH
eukprot:Gregarina_sp_Pseudo_9__454@NODE_1293_length_1709_cov_308_243114_g1216_i0_p1_GENE_NODE_1293_length_1709_cov_308_243114_g1216_i0NODE_1293_length_1709_cov_308_243114_g1216_i0_p1_ORF_typecomplete_len367_score83_07Integrin_beta/PF00362_18/1_6e22VWA/PF00092_28/7_4e06_NODE_1293_length_1709_cov_308_243114_g1216_i02591359